MTDIIDLIKGMIIPRYKNFKEEKKFVDRDFFEDEQLKSDCKNNLKSLFLVFFGREYDLSDSDFDVKYDIAIKDVRYEYFTIMNPSVSVRKEYSESWLTDEKIEALGWNKEDNKTYRGRYLKYLHNIGRSKDVIDETSRSSLEIIKKTGDPESSEPFFVKGLVIGSVQSGKTANFNAVLNSAIDTGYKLIIVLSGLMEDLRYQTQCRIEKDVVGKMQAPNKFMGVGEVASYGELGRFNDVAQIVVLTSRERDFNRNMKESDFSLNQKNILICKKNTSVLQNLLLWLNDYLESEGDKHDIPFLIIDDEADNASLNNLGHKGKEFANKINGHIRALLAMFERKTYIGYTATPFANILQDYNDKPEEKWNVTDPRNKVEIRFDQVGNLFPDDFIELLNPPSNYIGAKHFFETKLEEIEKIEPLIAPPLIDHIQFFPERVETMDDGTLECVKKYRNKTEFEDDPDGVARFSTFREYKQRTRATTKWDPYPVELPKSLDEAVKSFVISIAIRLSRKAELNQSQYYQRHHTMLIHISRFSEWQCTTKTLVQDLVHSLREKLYNDDLVSYNSIYLEFERIWVKYYEYVVNNIKGYLPQGYNDDYLSARSFDDIKGYLVQAIQDIEVKAVNTVAKDSLDYESPSEKKYIVVGGNKLSRGFTLEGLTINYFIRNTDYADTLMQMGRWFGYRPGYLDCCKLFTTMESLEKFDQVTWTIEELEEEFRKLSTMKMKPVDYAIKVRMHPGALQITRPAILKNATVEKWSFEDKLIQTTEFRITGATIESSWSNLKKVYSHYRNGFESDDAKKVLRLQTDTNGLADFMDSQMTYTGKFEKDAILRYIRLCNQYDKLVNWTVVIKATGQSDRTVNEDYTGFAQPVKLTKRKGPGKKSRYYSMLMEDNLFKASGASSNILAGGQDMSYTLSETEIERVESDFHRIHPESSTVPEKVYRENMKDTDGLMVIYLMDLESVFGTDELKEKAITEEIDIKIPLIGFALGIPPIGSDIGGHYLVNEHILQNIENNKDDEILTDYYLDEESDVEMEAIESES